MPRKKKVYRKVNYYASVRRTDRGLKLHPHLLDGLKKIARAERKTVNWLIETALSDYFGVEVMLRKCKTSLEAYSRD